jgi:hypothetical protein
VGSAKDLSDFDLSRVQHIKGLKVLWTSEIPLSRALSWPRLFDPSVYSLEIELESYSNINITVPFGVLSCGGDQLLIDVAAELPSDQALFRDLDAYSFKCIISCWPRKDYETINRLCLRVGDIIVSGEGQTVT